MGSIDIVETELGASSTASTADGAQKHSDYSLYYKWVKQSHGPTEASGETM